MKPQFYYEQAIILVVQRSTSVRWRSVGRWTMGLQYANSIWRPAKWLAFPPMAWLNGIIATVVVTEIVLRRLLLVVVYVDESSQLIALIFLN